MKGSAGRSVSGGRRAPSLPVRRKARARAGRHPKAFPEQWPARTEGPSIPDRGWRLALVTSLRTTLDPEALVALFSAKVADLVPHTGLRFAPARGGPALTAGKEGESRCNHRLMVEGVLFGEVTFSRSGRFSPDEAAVLGGVLMDLAYPLRNALMYREALAAATRDPLTGAGNRAGLDAALPREVELARRHGTPLSVIMADVDRFKSVNDRFGHPAGDAVLEGFAARIRSCIRSSDLLFRIGGEEFAILASNTPLDGAALLAERIRGGVAERPFDTSAGRVAVTASFGVACHRRDESGAGLLARADGALYAAKAGGRNRVETVRSGGRPAPDSRLDPIRGTG